MLPESLPTYLYLQNRSRPLKQGGKSLYTIFIYELLDYAKLLIQIFNGQDLNTQAKCKVLLQLEKHLKVCWRARKIKFTAQQKQQIKQSIMASFLHCPPQSTLINTYKQIIISIIKYQYRNWSIISIVLKQIRLGQNRPRYLQLLLAIIKQCKQFLIRYNKTNFYNLIRIVLPLFLKQLNEITNSQLVYLSIKFLFRAMPFQIRSTVGENLSFLLKVIGSTYPIYDNDVHQVQERGSEQFYYFHSKKWATRVLHSFILKYGSMSIEYGRINNCISLLVQQFSINTTKKNRFHQLNCLNALIENYRNEVKKYSSIFQYDILVKLLKLTPSEEELALRQPIQFIQRQRAPVSIEAQLRSLATKAWIRFSSISSFLTMRQKDQPETHFFKNLAYLKGKLQENNQEQLEVTLYLLSSVCKLVEKCVYLHHFVENIIIQHVIPNFQNQHFCIRARALEVFQKYYFIKCQGLNFQKLLQDICDYILKQEHNLVRLKAISVYCSVTVYRNAKVDVPSCFQQVLETILQFVQYYGQYSLGKDFQTLINSFSSQIQSFAYSIICRMCNLFIKMFAKEYQIRNSNKKDDQACSLAIICLKTVKSIIQSPLKPQVISQAQPQILSILQYAFIGCQNIYTEDYLLILENFILKVETISQMAFFLYKFIVYRIVGVHISKLQQINEILKYFYYDNLKPHIQQGDMRMLQIYFPILRNYIYKISQMGCSQPNYGSFKNQFIILFLHLINEVYEKGINYQRGESNIFCCTALMINFVQNFQKSLPPNVYTQIWQFSRKNMRLFRTRKINLINSQLIGLLLWVSPLNILIISQRQNMFQPMIAQITRKKYQQEYQRARLILGISSVLSLSQKPSFFIPKIVELFKANIKLVKMNINKRLKIRQIAYMVQEESQYIQMEEGDGQNQIEGEDHFLHEKNNCNSSYLGFIDEIHEFGSVLQRLSIEQDDLYEILVNSVEDDITELRQKILMVPRKDSD